MERWLMSICVGMWRGRGGLIVLVLFVLVGVRLVAAERRSICFKLRLEQASD